MKGGGESEESSVLEPREKKVPISKGWSTVSDAWSSSVITARIVTDLENGHRSKFLRVGE